MGEEKTPSDSISLQDFIAYCKRDAETSNTESSESDDNESISVEEMLAHFNKGGKKKKSRPRERADDLIANDPERARRIADSENTSRSTIGRDLRLNASERA